MRACTKDQLLKVAEHFEIELRSQRCKACILGVIKDRLFQLGVLSAAVKGSDTQRAVSPQVSCWSSL